MARRDETRSASASETRSLRMSKSSDSSVFLQDLMPSFFNMSNLLFLPRVLERSMRDLFDMLCRIIYVFYYIKLIVFI